MIYKFEFVCNRKDEYEQEAVKQYLWNQILIVSLI